MAASSLGTFGQLSWHWPKRNLTMEITALLAKSLSALREFLAPSYRPELHYMRGPRPAYARRAILVESKRVLPLLRSPQR